MLVSIVIPIYNPGDKLNRCIQSAIAQSYSDIEIILINDGSTDDSDKICREFTLMDNRIVYISQKNSGVSAARNKGIAEAKGEYICFIDSDDYVDDDYVSTMVDAIKNYEADIIIQGLKLVKHGRVCLEEAFESGIYPVWSLPESLFDKLFYYCGPYCKLFKTSVIRENNLYFPLGLSYGEDAVFYHVYLEACKVIEFLPNTSYNYSVGSQGALSAKPLSPGKFWQNQSNRRGAYKRLKKKYGLPGNISPNEQLCKLIGIAGMLNSIFKFCTDDNSVAHYIGLMNNDTDFGLNEINASSLKSKITISLVKSNNKLSRMLLKKIYG